MIFAVPDLQELSAIYKVLPNFLLQNDIPFRYHDNSFIINDDFKVKQSGVGIINSAKFCRNINEQVVLIGSCGAKRHGLYLVKQSYYDIDLTSFNRPRGEVPNLPFYAETSSHLNKKIEYICTPIPCASVTSDSYGSPFTPNTDLPIIHDMEDRVFLEMIPNDVAILRYATDDNDPQMFVKHLPTMGVELSKFIINFVTGRKVYPL